MLWWRQWLKTTRLPLGVRRGGAQGDGSAFGIDERGQGYKEFKSTVLARGRVGGR